MASGYRDTGQGNDHATLHHTKLTVVCADQGTLNRLPNLIKRTFGGILHKFREHREEGSLLLGAASIRVPYYCQFNIRPTYHGSEPDYFFNKFLHSCRLWCELCNTYNWKLWMSTDMEAAYTRTGRTSNVHVDIKLSSFSLGCMEDRWTFVEHYKHISLINPDTVTKGNKDKSTSIDFEHDSRFFTMLFHCQSDRGVEYEYKLRVRYDDLQEFVLVDYPQDRPGLSVYFMLKAPPTIKRIDRDSHTPLPRVTRTCCCSTEIIGNSSVLSISVSEESCRTFQSVISRFQVFKYKIYWTCVSTRISTSVASAALLRFGGDFELVYILECLLSQGFLITDRASRLFAILNNIHPKDHHAAQKALQQLALQVDLTLEGDRFLDLAEQFKINFKAAIDSDDVEDDHYDNCRFVRRAIVTPTRCLLLPAELMAENRVLREYGEEFCMRVVFRDETFGKLGSFDTSQSDEITRRVVDVLTSGIHIGDRCYDFLACSNSQLRDHGCWLYSKDLKGNTASNVRQWMGTFTNITCVATYVSRMGQCFSTSEESVKVTVEAGQVEHEDDIKSADGKYCFSDGIGRVSSSLAAKITGNRKKKIPSAFQIRYAGCKGMIGIDPRLDGDKLIYRTSMEKFQSDHKTIEIMNNSRPCRLYLNRQAITLLSGLGVGDDIFKELQEGLLYELGGMFFDDDVAAKSLSRRAAQQTSINYRKVVEAGIRLTSEPFFRGLLLAVYRNSIGQLQRKARIEIPSHLGRYMVGVMDETGELDSGQVFVQYSKHMDKPQVTKKVHTGTVVITKSPALAPGDIRKFEAVDVPELHHMVDCVVFPQRGKRPHPDEMAGSDLDGDEYFVTWMPGLRFEGANQEPMDFTPPQKLRHDGPIQVSDMIKYMANYIKNDNVGLIANAHLAQADRNGIFSQVCMSIAKKFSKAVDFAKTGYSPDLGKGERPYMYPDFMGKLDKSTYRSSKILGHLYRQCRQIDRIAIHQKDPVDVPPDVALEYPGRQTFQQDAERSLNRYNRQLEAILTQYGITSESEALSGNIGRLNKRMSQRNEIYDAKKIVTLKVKHLWNKTRRAFFDEFGGKDSLLVFPEESLAKASAWYIVTYKQRDKKYLSFPWVVSDVLCEVRKRNPDALTIIVPSVMGRLAIEAEGYQLNATNENLCQTTQGDPRSNEDLSVIFHYLEENPWMRTAAGVLMKWRETQKLDKEVGRIDFLVLLCGFAIQRSFIIEAGQQAYCNEEEATQLDDHGKDEKPIKLLVEFLSFCATRMFYHEEHRYVPVSCQKPRLSNPHVRKLATLAEKAYHQLALCGTIHSILQVYDNSSEEFKEEFVTVGNDLGSFFTAWQGILSNEFPKVGISIRPTGQGNRPNGKVSIMGPQSEVNEVQDRIQEWEVNPRVFEEDIFEDDTDELSDDLSDESYDDYCDESYNDYHDESYNDYHDESYDDCRDEYDDYRDEYDDYRDEYDDYRDEYDDYRD
ncbi:uncharacterized protein [Amphiura filiformis]|uniref:uncharacterized protein n=1 Tax=Amphiura filiformis TaxID=82378 RepID=UPI003B21F0FD